MPSARVTDVAKVMIGDRDIKTVVTGIRPGEKVHEILVSQEEGFRTVVRSEQYYAVLPMLPELQKEAPTEQLLGREYSSADYLMDIAQLKELLGQRLLTVQATQPTEELLA